MNPQPIGEMQEVPLLRLLVAGLIGVGANGQLNFTYPAFASGNGNAEVPSSAPIQPAQAFVDSMIYAITTGQYAGDLGYWYFPGKGITSVVPEVLFAVIEEGEVITNIEIDLSGNAIPTANINAILAMLQQANVDQGGITGTCNLTGGTNGPATGQGLTDKASLIAAGMVVTTN